MNTINKNRKKRKPYDGIRALAVKAAAKEFEVTEIYVRACIRGDYDTPRAIEIKKFFTDKYSALQTVLS